MENKTSPIIFKVPPTMKKKFLEQIGTFSASLVLQKYVEMVAREGLDISHWK